MLRQFHLLAGCHGFGVTGVGLVGPRASWGGKRGVHSVAQAATTHKEEAHHSAAHCLGSCVLHVAPGGKGNGLAQLNTSFVFIKRMGMLVLAVDKDV